MKVVQKQVAGSNKNMVGVNMDQIDQRLTEAEKYLLKSSLLDVNSLSLGSYPVGSKESAYNEVNIFTTLTQSITYYSDLNAFFAYNSKTKTLIFAAQQNIEYMRKEAIRTKLTEIMENPEIQLALTQTWIISNIGGEYALFRIMETGEKSYLGVWVDLNRYLKPFNNLNSDSLKGQLLIASSDGTILANVEDSSLSQISSADLQQALTEDNKLYSLMKYGDDRSEIMVVSRKSQIADIYLAVLLPVKSLLEQLPLFQYLIYITPVLAIVILVIFLYYIRRSIALPVHRLLKGMQNMRSGNFMLRLEPSTLTEFNNISETFNAMSGEIEDLKIDIYEEKLNTQKAELRHLQAQIHPHFFTNCLNLIYSLAQVNNIEQVQKLTLHLAQHLRFTIRTNVTSVSLQEELDHIENYLIIQKVRFPDGFEYRIKGVQDVLSFQLPPLTVQPFVENAIQHGFNYIDEEPFTIEISTHVETYGTILGTVQDYLVIKVSDNGIGFNASILEKLQSGEYFREEFDRHIGIRNVHHRCNLFYGAETSIKFANNPQGGAEVTLKLPVEKVVPKEDLECSEY
ncbi:sensor histidine kinase [Paenibacillus sabinae]|nr:histidine kinase [Paenibacillus sabinae]